MTKHQLVLTAMGAYQLEEVLKASNRLAEKDIPHSVVYMLEPGRFRNPRTDGEQEHLVPPKLRAALYPNSAPCRIFVAHTRPEPMLGVLQPLHTGGDRTKGMGFLGQGGTLTVPGMLFVNRCGWAHIVAEAGQLLDLKKELLLSSKEIAALEGKTPPEGVII